MSDSQNHIKLPVNAAQAIDDYVEYTRIVGEDDGGVTFTPEEYEAYKKKHIPQRMKNRIYVSWVNPEDVDCILPGPETECFCQHRYKQHKTDFEVIPDKRPLDLPCKHCNCTSFNILPKFNGRVARCHCKHEATEHGPLAPFLCSRSNCNCVGFKTSATCDCGYPSFKHRDLVETAAEREARGHPLGMATPYQAMGGLTGFSSLAPGFIRMDPSGKGGLLTQAEVDAPITANDHPFLRANAAAVYQHKLAINDIEGAERQKAEMDTMMRRPNESELEFYERRYKEKQSGQSNRKPITKPSTSRSLR